MPASFPASVKSFATLVDLVDSVLASHQNDRALEIAALETQLMAWSLYAGFVHSTTMSGTVTLADSDSALQRLDCDGANRIVKLPAYAVSNHAFLILNVSSAPYTLDVQSNGGVSLFVSPLGPGESVLVLPDGAAGYLAAKPNLELGLHVGPSSRVINGEFRYAQRQNPDALTTIADNKYGPDRWRITRANAEVQFQRVTAIGVTGLSSSWYGSFKKITNSGKVHICQVVESSDSVPLCSRQVTFQAQLWGNSARTLRMAVLELAAAGTADTIPATLVTAFGADTVDPTLGANVAVIGTAQSKAAGTSPALFWVTVTVPSNSKNLICAVWSDSGLAAGDVINIAEAGLYAGPGPRAWGRRPVQQELALCQRYYEKSYDIDTAPASNLYTGMVACFGQSNKFVSGLRFKVSKRVTAPTIVLYSKTGTANKVASFAGADTGTSVTAQDAGQDGVPYCGDSGTPFVGATAYLYHYTCEAEL